MNYHEFIQQMKDGTQIQKIEKMKSFFGKEIEFLSFIKEVDKKHIRVSIPKNPTDIHGMGTLVFLKDNTEELFREQLLSLSFSDEVKIVAQINKWESDIISIPDTDFRLDLISIQVISTLEGRERERVDREKAAIKERTSMAANNNSGCFIATACYGNYNAPEVLVLRQFRDERLLKTIFGQIIVKLYYTISPFFARLISKSDLLKKIIRKCLLEKLVSKLKQVKNSI